MTEVEEAAAAVAVGAEEAEAAMAEGVVVEAAEAVARPVARRPSGSAPRRQRPSPTSSRP
jgi:hypothetical protein